MLIPSSWVTILKESVIEDEFGDPKDDYLAVQTGVAAHIYETSALSFDPKSGRSSTLRTLKALLAAGTTIDKGYRIKDEATDEIFVVTDVIPRYGFTGYSNREVELERLT